MVVQRRNNCLKSSNMEVWEMWRLCSTELQKQFTLSLPPNLRIFDSSNLSFVSSSPSPSGRLKESRWHKGHPMEWQCLGKHLIVNLDTTRLMEANKYLGEWNKSKLTWNSQNKPSALWNQHGSDAVGHDRIIWRDCHLEIEIGIILTWNTSQNTWINIEYILIGIHWRTMIAYILHCHWNISLVIPLTRLLKLPGSAFDVGAWESWHLSFLPQESSLVSGFFGLPIRITKFIHKTVFWTHPKAGNRGKWVVGAIYCNQQIWCLGNFWVDSHTKLPFCFEVGWGGYKFPKKSYSSSPDPRNLREHNDSLNFWEIPKSHQEFLSPTRPIPSPAAISSMSRSGMLRVCVPTCASSNEAASWWFLSSS